MTGLALQLQKVRKRRVVHLILLFVIAASTPVWIGMGMSPQAEAITPPDTCFAFTPATGTITNYYANEGNNAANPACPKAVDIPYSIGGVAVLSITAQSSNIGGFTGKAITSVTIPNSVTSIGQFAFQNNQLTSIVIPDSVTSIGSGAFMSNQLASVTMPSNLTSIGSTVFGYNKLASVSIPSSVTSIGISAFISNQLTSVTIPSGVTTIGAAAFALNQLTSVTIPSGVTTIADQTFMGNQLTALTIPNSVTSIGSSAFSSNTLLTTVTIPGSVATIGSAAFYGDKLTSVTMFNGVTTIGANAFALNSLTSVVIPNSVTTVGGDAFYGNKLTTVTVENPATTDFAGTWSGNPALDTFIIGGVTYNHLTVPATGVAPDTCFTFTPATGTITNYNTTPLSPTIATVLAGTFSVCPTDLTLPYSIGGAAVLNIAGPDAYTGAFQGKGLTSVVIPNSVTSIGTHAFQGNHLTSVTIPNSVTALNTTAFYQSSIAHLTIDVSAIPSNSALFQGRGMQTLTLGSHVATIASDAFANNQLTTITAQNQATADAGAWTNNPNLTTIIVNGVTHHPTTKQLPVEDCIVFNAATGAITGYASPVSASITAAYADTWGGSCASGSTLVIPSTINGVAVTSITGPNSYTGAFQSKGLTSVTIPSSVTSIGDYAFASNPLETLYLEGSPTLGASAIPTSSFDIYRVMAACPNATALADYIPCYQAEVARVQSDGQFLRVYTPHPEAFPTLQNHQIITETMYSSLFGLPAPAVGGVLVNPASLTVNYANASNGTIAPALMAVGKRANGTLLTSYSLGAAGTYPVPVDPANPTVSEQAAIAAYWAQFFTRGDTVVITLPDVFGYVTPNPKVRSFTLTSTQMTEVINYQAIPVLGALASTGANLPLIAGGAGVVVVLGVAGGLFAVRRRKYRMTATRQKERMNL